MALLFAQDVFEQAPRGGVLVADQRDELAVGLDGHALGDQVGLDHGFQIGRFVIPGVAATGQRIGREIGLAAELHDAHGKAIRVGRFLARMHRELFGDLGRGQTVGREMVALVAQYANQLGGQRVVEQIDDVLAPGAVMGCDGAAVEVALGGVERRRVQRQAVALGHGEGLGCGECVVVSHGRVLSGWAGSVR